MGRLTTCCPFPTTVCPLLPQDFGDCKSSSACSCCLGSLYFSCVCQSCVVIVIVVIVIVVIMMLIVSVVILWIVSLAELWRIVLSIIGRWSASKKQSEGRGKPPPTAQSGGPSPARNVQSKDYRVEGNDEACGGRFFSPQRTIKKMRVSERRTDLRSLHTYDPTHGAHNYSRPALRSKHTTRYMD